MGTYWKIIKEKDITSTIMESVTLIAHTNEEMQSTFEESIRDTEYDRVKVVENTTKTLNVVKIKRK
jgi:hypothetical protein